ncbi:peptidase C14 caspase catalytic subunit p20 [Mesorhizobium tamadayense]|uniref:Peptidase C14 caspase catalytic subunit p20 n=1 Tax=Mesorhizobium tamadayense TaxID=425306 RepID=A0A3P3G5W9_9HYPH|nr:caspase family protein [Mesorhizobium tamadayense]RRI05449.1 peptidase C14 caspase catalytic subunit p20 [Mesorhizobium tamadayense]
MRTLQKFLGLVVVLIFFAVSAATGALAQGEKRLAFVIGNGAYKTAELATAANDAGLIAQTLQAAGFDVVGARDVDQDSLRGAFRDFMSKVSAAGPDAVVFVYLAGHGVQFEGENYFLPVDAQIANPNDVPLQAMRISDITRPLSGLPTKVNIVVLDAARQNPFPKWKEPLAGGLALVDPDPNMLIAFNAAPGTVAPEDKGPYGAYAKALAEMMREGGLSLQDVFDRTRLRVSEVTQGGELPWSASKITAPFVFFERSAEAPPPKVSAAETRAARTRPIRDFDAHDAYVAALERDTMRGYEDFLDAYPHDAMAKRVRAIIAARREAITWRETWMTDTPEAYWSYLERYPHGPHAWDARRRLEHFDAELEPPESFTVIVYDVPPPPPEEIIYVERPVIFFDDFDFAPPPPITVIFLPPPPRDFVVLEPPPPPVDVFVLPTPVFVPIPVFINPPRHIVPPPNDIIFNNIHNTTVINNINTTIKNETINQAAQPGAGVQGGRTTGRQTTGGAVGARADALAARVALPPPLQKKAAMSRQITNQQQGGQKQGGLPPKPGQRVIQGQQPGTAIPQSETRSATGKLSRDHALPGANGKRLPLVNGKPALDGRNLPSDQNLPSDKSRKRLSERGAAGGNNQQATGNAGAAVTGQGNEQTGAGNAQGKNRKLRKLPTVNGMPAENQPGAREKFRKNNPNAFSDESSGRPRKLTRKDLSAGRSVFESGDQGSTATKKGRKFRKLPTVNGMPAENRPRVEERFRNNNPDVFSERNKGRARKLMRRDLSSGQSIVEPGDQGSANRSDRGRKFRRLQNEEGSAGGEVNVQRNFKVNRPDENAQRRFRQERPSEQVLRPQRQEPNENAQRQFRRERPNEQVLRPQRLERRPEFREQPRPQMQERRLPQQQPQEFKKKKPSCGQEGEPSCNQ